MSERKETDIIVPGTLLKEESYGDQKDHPEYAGYLQSNPEWVRTSQIMDHWTSQPIMSEGFSSCYPLIAVKPNGESAQAIHVSKDPWRLTSRYELEQKLSEWQKQQDGILLVRGEASSIISNEVHRLKERFRQQFHPVELNSDSRFGMVYDVKKRILMVQLTDDKILRVYQGL